jgi:hypothetical protein
MPEVPTCGEDVSAAEAMIGIFQSAAVSASR